MKKIMIIFFTILLIIITLFTGNPVVKNDQIINISVGVVGIIFAIWLLINKEEVLITKQSIAIAILCLTSIIPLVFNTYVSLYGTVYYIFRYIAVFSIYFMVSFLIKDDEKYKDYIKKLLIGSGIILVFFGIDLMTTEVSFEFVKAIIGKKADQHLETRMFSLFLYSNTFAIAAIVSYVLALGEIFKDKFKIVYGGILTILLSAILLTQSRICMLLMGVGLIGYFIFLNTENKYKFIKVLIVNGIFAVAYTVLFNAFRQSGNMILIWVMTVFVFGASGVLCKILMENEKINKIINVKTFITFAIAAVVIFFILTLFKSPLVLFNGENAHAMIYKEIKDIEPNTNYEIKLQVEAISNTESDNYTIAFIQHNKYSVEISRQEIIVNNCNEEFTVNLTTDENISLIEFNVKANETNENTKLIVKSLKLNDKEFVLNYRFLPTDIINKLKDLDLSQKSVWERGYFLKDGLSIISQNSLLGVGGDAWRYKQFDCQSYYYNALQMHCYVLQVFMDMGLIGVMSLGVVLVIAGMSIFKSIKEKNNIDLAVGVAFCILFAHTLLDFDMTFGSIMYTFYILIALIDSPNKDYTLKNPAKAIVVVVICVSCILLTWFNFCEKYIKETKKDELEKAKSYEEKVNMYDTYMRLVPYKEEYKMDKAEYLNMYANVMASTMSVEEIKNMNNEQAKLLKKCINSERQAQNVIDKCLQILKISNSEEDKKVAYKCIEEIFEKHRYNAKKTSEDYRKVFSLIYGTLQYYQEQINQNVSPENVYINFDIEKIRNVINNNIEKDIGYIQQYEKCQIKKEEAEIIITNIKGANGG